jgi:hypothetical protein
MKIIEQIKDNGLKLVIKVYFLLFCESIVNELIIYSEKLYYYLDRKLYD